MSETRKQLEPLSTNIIATKLLNKPKKSGIPAVKKAANAWRMYEYYVEKGSELELQLKELGKVVYCLTDEKNKDKQEKELLEKAIWSHDAVIEKLLLKMGNNFKEKKENGKCSSEELLDLLEEMINKANRVKTQSINIHELIESLCTEHDEICKREALRLDALYDQYVEKCNNNKKIELLLGQIRILNRIKNKSEAVIGLINLTKEEFEYLSCLKELEDIELEIAAEEQCIIEKQEDGESFDDHLVTIAELNEAMSVLYQSIGQVESQMNVLLTAKSYLDQLPVNDERKSGLYEEVLDAIGEIKENSQIKNKRI